MSADRPRTLLLAIALWIVFGFVVWNVVFDNEIRLASDAYLARQGAHDAGHGSAVTIDSFMTPAKTRGLRLASFWGGAAAVSGIALTLAAARHR
jgi:hypothetical protein